MIRLFMPVLAAFLSLSPATAQSAPAATQDALPTAQGAPAATQGDPATTPQPAPAAPPAAPALAAGDVPVTIETSLGTIRLAVHSSKAPVTAGNFLKYVDQKRLDGAAFYRGVGAADYGFVQGGAQNDPKRILPPIAHEPTSRTGLVHDDGALSMARYAPGTATGDFFIVLGRMPSMDAQPEAAGDNQGFAVFAHVIGGLDVVKGILAAPKSPTKGEGVMRGQMLEAPVTIRTARRGSVSQ